MAVQDSLGYVAGTPLIWDATGTGTYNITCTSLASGSSRQGAKSASLVVAPPGLVTAILPDFLRVSLQLRFTSAPTTGKEVSVYLGFSDSSVAGTDNPGGLSGLDSAGPNSDRFPQLVFAGALIASNDIGAGIQLQYLTDVQPKDNYVMPLIHNNTDVNFNSTAAHTVLILTPYYSLRNT